MSSRAIRYTHIAVACLASIFTVGCSTLRESGFVPAVVNVDSRHTETVYVTAGMGNNGTAENIHTTQLNGGPTPQMDTPYEDMFESATVHSIEDCGLFPIASSRESTDYILELTILRTGAATTHTVLSDYSPSAHSLLVVKWCLIDKKSDSIFCQKKITTSSAHDAPDYMFGGMYTAPRNAMEATAAENIRQGIEWLARKTTSIAASS